MVGAHLARWGTFVVAFAACATGAGSGSGGAPPCNAQSCPKGCCLANSCQPGLSDQACGKSGIKFIDCSAQMGACLNGFCVVN
jgi:hypothetical protein